MTAAALCEKQQSRSKQLFQWTWWDGYRTLEPPMSVELQLRGHPGGLERLFVRPVRVPVDDLSVAQLEEPRKRDIELDARVPRRRSEAVDGNHAVSGVDDSLQLDAVLLVRREERSPCSADPFAASIHLANVIGQDLVGIRDVRREVWTIDLAPTQCTRVERLQIGSEALDDLLRHRALATPKVRQLRQPQHDYRNRGSG